jgi:hypothetical protein
MGSTEKPPKLTPNQWTVLRNAKAGQVYRSESGHDLYACYDQAQKRKRVTTVVARLCTLGLLKIGEQDRMQRPWHVTERGEKVLLGTEST